MHLQSRKKPKGQMLIWLVHFHAQNIYNLYLISQTELYVCVYVMYVICNIQNVNNLIQQSKLNS